jgi:hypothetical protein
MQKGAEESGIRVVLAAAFQQKLMPLVTHTAIHYGSF